MKKIVCILICLIILLSSAACSQISEAAQQGAGLDVVHASAGKNQQDTSPVTILVSQGNSEAYYRTLAEMIKTELGIDVEFVYQVCADTTSLVRLYFEHNELPADIIFTASKTDDNLLKSSCVDLLSRSSVTAAFTPKTVQECTTDDGAIYQLPISSRLIGITYNETLLKEMGWDVPNDFIDMLELKAKCDEAGIKFSVSDGAATGHGFNWLFHLMGSEWLSTPEGTEWFEGFQKGERSVDEFKNKCDYFKKWTEAGLWGNIHTMDWAASTEFSQTRALFWFGLVNTVSGYDGMMYDDNGNETGVMLHDSYKSIPWISEHGDNNCYTYYDNCWVYVNKALEAPDKSEKLQKVFEILKFMTTDQAVDLITNISSDTYVSVSSYEMGDDRLYSAYRETIRNGFLQPWYYNEFDQNSIVFTGEAVNSYITGKGGFDDIFVILDKYNREHVNAQVESIATFPDGLGFEDTAKLAALSAATAFNMTLEKNGISDSAQVSIIPYTTDWNQLMPCKSVSVSNSIVFPGDMDASYSNTIIPNGAIYPVGVYMTGAEIKALVDRGYDPSDRNINADTGESTYDSEHYGPFPYLCMIKDNSELKDDETYLVVLSETYVTAADYSSFRNNGKIIDGLENPYSTQQGFHSFAASHPSISPADIVW